MDGFRPPAVAELKHTGRGDAPIPDSGSLGVRGHDLVLCITTTGTGVSNTWPPWSFVSPPLRPHLPLPVRTMGR